MQVHRGRLSAHAGAGALDDAHVVLAVVAPGQYTDAGDDEQDDASEDHWSAFRFVAHTVVLTTVPVPLSAATVPVVRVPGVHRVWGERCQARRLVDMTSAGVALTPTRRHKRGCQAVTLAALGVTRLRACLSSQSRQERVLALLALLAVRWLLSGLREHRSLRWVCLGFIEGKYLCNVDDPPGPRCLINATRRRGQREVPAV